MVGEAPGANEDIKGVPFVGKSGGLMRAAFTWAGIDMDRLYVTNTVLCRPPGNNNPTDRQIGACSERLRKVIDIIDPKLVIPVGVIATSVILQDPGRITKISGDLFFEDGRAVIPLMHPAYVMRNREERLSDFEEHVSAIVMYAILNKIIKK